MRIHQLFDLTLMATVALAAVLTVSAKASTYSDLILSDGAVAYYRLGEHSAVGGGAPPADNSEPPAQGGTAVDELGNNSGSYFGGASTGVSGATNDGDAAVGFNSEYFATERQRLKTRGPYVQVRDGDDSLDLTGQGTLEAWINMSRSGATAVPPRQTIVAKGESLGPGNNPINYHLMLFDDVQEPNNPARHGFHYARGTPLEADVTWQMSTEELAALQNTWTHVVLTIDGSNGELFLDGVSQGVKTIQQGFLAPTVNGPFWIGGFDHFSSAPKTGFQKFKGAIDEVAIYPAVLTNEEITEHYEVASRGGVRTHATRLPAVKGVLHVYATFDVGSSNPLPLVGGKLQGNQRITLGQFEGERLTPVVRFGLRESHKLTVAERPFITPYLFDGRLHYYGMYARPGTPYDFKLSIDLNRKRLTAWVSGRGDDEWFRLADEALLINDVTAIDGLEVEQFVGARGIRDIRVTSEPWSPGETVRPHPSAKQNRAVRPGAGIHRQPMRSVWRKPQRHVTVSRGPAAHHAFPDVAMAGPDHLVCVFNHQSHTGGENRLSVAHSYDCGRTWDEPVPIKEGEAGCPRIQRLQDGALLLLGEAPKRASSLESTDGGSTWTNLRWLRGKGASCPSRVAELADGSWLVGTVYFPKQGNETEKLQFYRSTDRAITWKFWSEPPAYPPFNLSEQSIIELPDGRLLMYAREVRDDGSPGLKAYSNDKGKTWEIHELPFAVVGRTCAELLKDGRVLLTFRTMIGRPGLWAWVGDPDDSTPYLAAGAHFNDNTSVGLQKDALHIDGDGARGQFTQYYLRQPDSTVTMIDVSVEVKVLANSGRAATLSVPYVGKLRVFRDRVELAHDGVAEPILTAAVTPDEFHVYRVVRRNDSARLTIDGKVTLEVKKPDQRLLPTSWASPKCSLYRLAFGNEPETPWPLIHDYEISRKVTGYSVWRRASVVLDDPQGGKYTATWRAGSDGFPDQYQLDHIIEVDASIVGNDQGYSGWVELEDGRVFVVNYTDDTAPMIKQLPNHPWPLLGVPWIRGTFLLPADLPGSGL